ncbi:hypothetical protein FE257_003200 [Aspergillus nanangensis]|uniref:Xylanolytic transcriptional activator regulatory domain-containing protein n=1 Tax=Aspergillus nanangensis TaxID=2582783 RepID=A0AAD4CBT1_ASPNN|nr:hypothetical protein FE257_003200 [Aspergillus nanangensis]
MAGRRLGALDTNRATDAYNANRRVPGPSSSSATTLSTETIEGESGEPSRSVLGISQDVALNTPRAEPGGGASDGGDHIVADTDTHDAPLQQDLYGHVHGSSSVFAFLNIAKQKLTSLPSMSIDFCDYPLFSSRALLQVLPPKEVADQLIKTYFNFGLSTSRFVHEPTFRFYEMADQQLAKLPSRITLTSIQARLLVVHYLLNHSRMHEAWSSFGYVVRHAQALGLHCRARKSPDDCIVHEFRKRVFWVIYINDRILSSIFGRPCAIHDDDIDQEECVLSNDEDMSVSTCRPAQPDILCSAAALVHYARLAHILGKILRQFYSLTAKRQTLSQFYQMAITFEAALSDWQSALPEYLNFTLLPSSALSVVLHRQVSTLKLTYAYANILLYRPFMLHSIGMANSIKHAEFETWVKRCHDESIAAANMIVFECQSLQKRGLFSKVFWMVNYAQFAAIGTLYMYHHLWPDANHAWRVAEDARSQFTVGVEGDLVGQRYAEILSEFSRITSSHDHELSNNSEMSESVAQWPHGGDALAAELPTLDLGGPWSNLFFDQNIAGPGEAFDKDPANQSPILYGNDGELQDVQLLTPCSPDATIEEMQRKFREDGVLWVKNLLDPTMINEFRGEYLAMINEGSGMLKDGTDTRDGIFNPDADWRQFLLGGVRVAAGIPNEGPFVEKANGAHQWKTYVDFKDNIGRQLEPFVGKLAGFNKPWCLPRSLLRLAVPGGDTTPVHYDQIFLRAGPPTSVTAWVPLGDVEIEGGGLIYLARSHDIGVQYEADFSVKNSGLSDEERLSAFNQNMLKGGWLDRYAATFGDRYKRAWLVGNYEAGDVIFHTPYSIHAGAQNRSPTGRIRASTDLRFVDETKPYDKRWTVVAFSENDKNVAR